jgi:hypothetical protein
MNYFVPVVDIKGTILMPTTLGRAKKWIKSGRATPFYNKGILCIRLNEEIKDPKLQEVAVGIDPGSKKEGLTVKSKAHTFLNIQADAVTWVKDHIEARRDARKFRRYRKTPCRKNRTNRSRGGLTPSTKARWQWKLRLLNWFKKMYHISVVIVEDIKAITKGQKKWDTSFSPLEVGKNWFYNQLDRYVLKQGWETKQMRDDLGLKKLSNKMSSDFHAHCVDSWVLANDAVSGHLTPDNKKVMLVRPLRFHRRQLHVFVPAKGNMRKRYGGTRSLGFKRGSLVRHVKHGLSYVGGVMRDRISIHSLDGKRLCQNAKPTDCCFITRLSWVVL